MIDALKATNNHAHESEMDTDGVPMTRELSTTKTKGIIGGGVNEEPEACTFVTDQ